MKPHPFVSLSHKQNPMRYPGGSGSKPYRGWTLLQVGSFGIGLLLCPLVRGDDPPPPPLQAFTVPGVEPRAADADAPLAAGFPQATRPGVIEVKAYPAYRGATARGKNATLGSDNILFYPLFLHISRLKIEMTAPVVNTFDPAMIARPGTLGDVTMEFVYRTPTTGQVGRGVGAVVVEDHPARSFVCLGVQGDLDPEKLAQAGAALDAWLAAHPGEWIADGGPRRLGYHSPMVDKDARLWEVQIPVKKADKAP